MSKDSLCAQHTDCSGCPKAMESTLIHRNLLRGQHIPKDKCTQNCMLFMIEGELLINSDEHPGTTLHEKQFILQAIAQNTRYCTDGRIIHPFLVQRTAVAMRKPLP